MNATMECWKEYADTYCQLIRRMVDADVLPPEPVFVASVCGLRVSKNKRLSVAKVDRLAWLLPQLPPLISRQDVEKWLPFCSGKTVANADCVGTGPRVRYKHGKQVVYPTAYLLEWIEQKGLGVSVQDYDSSTS